jgi:hypothetical protein
MTVDAGRAPLVQDSLEGGEWLDRFDEVLLVLVWAVRLRSPAVFWMPGAP